MKFGRSTVTIEAKGCYDCGALWAPIWVDGPVVMVTINRRVMKLQLHICGKCSTARVHAKNAKARKAKG